jgi:superfamily II DNA/RNA helicase
MSLLLLISTIFLVDIGRAFEFSSQEGKTIVQNLITAAIPGFEAHNYQLEGVCKVLDNIDLVAVTPTGSGKTGFLFLTMAVALAISKSPTLVPASVRHRFPKDPAMVIVAPTNSIELQMVFR